MVWVGFFTRSSCSKPCPTELEHFQDGVFTASLGKLFQCLTTFITKKASFAWAPHQVPLTGLLGGRMLLASSRSCISPAGPAFTEGLILTALWSLNAAHNGYWLKPGSIWELSQIHHSPSVKHRTINSSVQASSRAKVTFQSYSCADNLLRLICYHLGDSWQQQESRQYQPQPAE